MWPRRRERFLAALILLLPAPALAQGAFLEGGLSFARGDYVYTEATSSGAASVGLSYSTARVTARLSVPFFLRDTRLLTVKGPESVETSPATTGAQLAASIADPVAQVFVSVHRGPNLAVGASAAAKIPLVAAGDFGTGQWDFGGGLSLSRFLGTGTLLGLDLSYWRMGDLPDLDLRDPLSGTLTVGRALGRFWTASVSLSGGRSTVDGYHDPWWLGLLASRVFPRGIWGLTVSVGLTDTSPDFSLGVIWRFRVD